MIFNFRNWVLQTFPFLEDDFDALTDYELFCKMVEYMKKSLDKIKDYQNELNDFRAELDTYKNYFDNLDVQEEINNKLDEMAEDGTLENIISEYIQLQATYTYNSVSEMKLATNLVNGSFARTNGFYSNNDGGASLYKVRTIINDDVVDEKTIIALYDNSLVAELVIEKVMSVKQFGAKGDNTTDDTDYIQTALNYCNNIIIDNGNYKIDIDKKLNLNNNQIVNLINANLISINSVNGDSWERPTAIFNINAKDNIIINGNNCYLQGDRNNHENTNHQFGFGVLIIGGSENITVKNLLIKDFTGDGVILWNGVNKNITIDNVTCDNNHRQGMSLVGCENVLINNSRFINTNGTAPQCGIDIEPDSGNYCNNIKIINCFINNNNGDGLLITNYAGLQQNPQIDYINNLIVDKCIFSNNNGSSGINITHLGITTNGNYILSNNMIYNNVRGLRIVSNYIQCNNNSIQNNSNDGIYLNSASYNMICNNNINKNLRYGVGIEDNSNYNKISNNEITLNNGDGISMYSGTNTTVNYNSISNNKIYKNSQSNIGSTNNVSIQNRCNYNYVTNNDFNCDTSTVNYDISTNNQGTNNVISNNMCKTGNSGAINLIGTNYTLMNIIDNSLNKGNLFI